MKGKENPSNKGSEGIVLSLRDQQPNIEVLWKALTFSNYQKLHFFFINYLYNMFFTAYILIKIVYLWLNYISFKKFNN